MPRVGAEGVVECMKPSTGERYLSYRPAIDFEGRYSYDNGPRSSPVINEVQIYTYGAQGELHFLTLETGQLVWQRDIATKFSVPENFFGVATNACDRR